MFTGIVEEVGRVKTLTKSAAAAKLAVYAVKILQDIKTGDSIAVNGACLSVVEIHKYYITFDIMKQTLDITNLGTLKAGDHVNLERALQAGKRFSGHMVTGHIDAMATIRNICKHQNPFLEILLPENLRQYALAKGSISIDGISLTIADCKSAVVRIGLIPYTLKNTNLGSRVIGDLVNIEMDTVAKILAHQKSHNSGNSIDINFLKDHGFIS